MNRPHWPAALLLLFSGLLSVLIWSGCKESSSPKASTVPRLDLSNFIADLKLHISYIETNKEWVTVSQLTITSNPHHSHSPLDLDEQIAELHEYLDRDGWYVISKWDNLETYAKKYQVYQKDPNRWHWSSTTNIEILPLPLELTTASYAVLDTPKNMIIGVFPPFGTSESLINRNYVRMYIPLHFAFDEIPHLSFDIAHPSFWSARGIVPVLWTAVKWLLGILVAVLASIITARLRKTFQKPPAKEPQKVPSETDESEPKLEDPKAA